MESQYHARITTEALEARVSERALQVIVRANLAQDRLSKQFGHPEYHFDNSAFEAGWAYVESQRNLVYQVVARRTDPAPAWRAFGRLSHAVQDFYAHSNYLQLWQARQAGDDLPPPEAVVAGDPDLLADPRLRSGRMVYPLEALTFLPGMTRLVRRWLPPDSHTWMNLDAPERGPLFPYALEAARQHTRGEFERISLHIRRTMGASAQRFFIDFRR